MARHACGTGEAQGRQSRRKAAPNLDCMTAGIHQVQCESRARALGPEIHYFKRGFSTHRVGRGIHQQQAPHKARFGVQSQTRLAAELLNTFRRGPDCYRQQRYDEACLLRASANVYLLIEWCVDCESSDTICNCDTLLGETTDTGSEQQCPLAAKFHLRL